MYIYIKVKKNMDTADALLIILTALLLIKIFGGGYSKMLLEDNNTSLEFNESAFIKQEKYEITPDIVNQLIEVSRKHLSSKYSVCVQPLGTNYINKYSDGTKTIYKCSFIFMKVGGDEFPYGFVSIVSILMEPTPTLLKLDLQEITNPELEKIKPYVGDDESNFVGFDAIIQGNIPKK